jgi:hypothetical protein
MACTRELTFPTTSGARRMDAIRTITRSTKERGWAIRALAELARADAERARIAARAVLGRSRRLLLRVVR